MAGLEESYSHVVASLFYVEAVNKVRDHKIVMQEKAYWMLPASCKEVPYKEIADIDFMSLVHWKKYQKSKSSRTTNL